MTPVVSSYVFECYPSSPHFTAACCVNRGADHGCLDNLVKLLPALSLYSETFVPTILKRRMVSTILLHLWAASCWKAKRRPYAHNSADDFEPPLGHCCGLLHHLVTTPSPEPRDHLKLVEVVRSSHGLLQRNQEGLMLSHILSERISFSNKGTRFHPSALSCPQEVCQPISFTVMRFVLSF